ncbi:MAG: helix-turn-helix domain-containing protein [Bacilli bacterium]
MNMIFSKRQRDILIELIKQENYITSKKLALLNNVSIRTIKSEVKQINSYLQVYDMLIESCTGLGYRINTVGNKEMADINLLLEDIDYERHSIINETMKDRTDYIAIKFLKEQDFVKSEQLLNELYISPSTLSHDLRQVKHIFKMFNLKIISKPYKGLYIFGDEINIRNCIDCLFFKKNKTKKAKYLLYGNNVLSEIGNIYNALTEIIESSSFKYPFYNLKDIAIQVYISIQRIKMDHSLKSKEINRSSDEVREIVEGIKKYVSDKYKINYNENEINRLECIIDTLYVMNDNKKFELEYKYLLDETFKDINYMFGINFQNDYTMADFLISHLNQLIRRSKNNVMINNPLTDKILKDYLLPVDIANVLADNLKEKYNLKISIDEFSYLVLYFNLTIYSGSQMKDKSLLVFCPTSRAEEQLIKEEVYRLFKEIVKQIKIVNKEELENKCYSNLDIIITNTELPVCIPEYIQVIRADLDNKMELFSKILIQLNEHVKGTFNINELLNEDMISNNICINSKEEYFEFLFDNLCEGLYMDYGEASHLYDCVEEFGQEIGSQIVFIRSQNKFVLPFIHITLAKEQFFWERYYAKLIIFVNFGDSNAEFRDFIYSKFQRIFSNKDIVDEFMKELSFETIEKELQSK